MKDKINQHLKAAAQQLKLFPVSILALITLYLQVNFHKEIPELFTKTQAGFLIVLNIAFIFYSSSIEEQKLSLRTKAWFLLSVLVVFVGTFLIWSYRPADTMLQLQMYLILFIGFVFQKSLLKDDDLESWAWQSRVSRAFGEGVVGAIAVLGASLLFVMLLEFVFEFKSPNVVYETIWKISLAIILGLVYLARLHVSREEISKYQTGLVRYVIIPLWALYVLFLNIYALKILVRWSLPKGMVAWPVTFAFIAFSLVWWAGIQLRKNGIQHFFNEKVDRIIIGSQFTLVILFWVAAFRRISEYGWTQDRYYLVLGGVFFAIIAILAWLKLLRGRWYAATLIAIVLLSLIKL